MIFLYSTLIGHRHPSITCGSRRSTFKIMQGKNLALLLTFVDAYNSIQTGNHHVFFKRYFALVLETDPLSNFKHPMVNISES